LNGCGPPPFAPQLAKPRVARIGLSWSGAAGSSASQIDAFHAGLRDAGWVEGQNLVIDERLYDDHPERMPDLAGELLALKPDILVGGLVPTEVFVRATNSIPIVFGAVPDPVKLGLVASFARPGGYVTGTSRTAASASTLTRKNLEFLRELMPGLARVAVAFSSEIAATVNDIRDIQVVAPSLGIDAQAVGIASLDDVEPALDAALAHNPQAVLVASTLVPQHLPVIAAWATRHGLPSAGGDVSAGCLFAYVADLPALWHRAASYHVDRILRGAKPADLPVEGPTVFNLVVNRTTVHALGVSIPAEFAAQVTEWVD
jgi:putative ABC transport system substrate-binding protein